jgi:hypothetical protein
MQSLCLIGRTSSLFTRVVSLFAHECGVPLTLQVVPNLLDVSEQSYGGNPALKLPNLASPDGVVFGSLNCCRRVFQTAEAPPHVLWPEHLQEPLWANAQELTLQAMSSEVSWIMSTLGGAGDSAYAAKLREGLLGTLTWLDQTAPAVLQQLPNRDLSYWEVCLFCLVEHLEFRRVVPLDDYGFLREFREQWAQRASARATPYRFDDV